MKSIEELKYYCSIDNPVGAILFTGEWGSGKTYIIENYLRNELSDKYIIIRISLFGIQSVEEIHNVIKKSWLNSKGGLLDAANGLSKYKNFFEKFSEIVPNSNVKSVINSFFSIDILDFITVENMIDKKKVILVFDDFERSMLTIEEKLGVINYYLEDLHFNTILIADENKIISDKYYEFKEKVIQRTIKHYPDYILVVKNMIDQYKSKDYYDFLNDNVTNILSVITGIKLIGKKIDQIDKNYIINEIQQYDIIDSTLDLNNKIKYKSNNIRSLIAAIQDFERVYEILKDKGIGNIEKWLVTFVFYSMAYKSFNVSEKSQIDNNIFFNDLSILFPQYSGFLYLPQFLVDWITKGIWNENSLDTSIEQFLYIEQKHSAKDNITTINIDYLDEDEAKNGLINVLDDAYKGKLFLDQYIVLIKNFSID